MCDFCLKNGSFSFNYIFIFSVSFSLHCATRRKVSDLIPDEVIGLFSLPNPSNLSLALELT
jgi:hypothetical protein